MTTRKREREEGFISKRCPKPSASSGRVEPPVAHYVDCVLRTELEEHLVLITSVLPVILPLDNVQSNINDIMFRIRSTLILILSACWLHESHCTSVYLNEEQKEQWNYSIASVQCGCSRSCRECPPNITINDHFSPYGIISTFKAFQYHADIIKLSTTARPRFLPPDLVKYITMFVAIDGSQTEYVHTCPTVQLYLTKLKYFLDRLQVHQLRESVIKLPLKRAGFYQKHICHNVSILVMEYLLAYPIHNKVRTRRMKSPGRRILDTQMIINQYLQEETSASKTSREGANVQDGVNEFKLYTGDSFKVDGKFTPNSEEETLYTTDTAPDTGSDDGYDLLGIPKNTKSAYIKKPYICERKDERYFNDDIVITPSTGPYINDGLSGFGTVKAIEEHGDVQGDSTTFSAYPIPYVFKSRVDRNYDRKLVSDAPCYAGKTTISLNKQFLEVCDRKILASLAYLKENEVHDDIRFEMKDVIIMKENKQPK